MYYALIYEFHMAVQGRAPSGEPGPSHQNRFFPTKGLGILLSLVSCPGGWSQTIPQVKKPDVVTCGLRLLGRLCVLPNFLKQIGRDMSVGFSIHPKFLVRVGVNSHSGYNISNALLYTVPCESIRPP